MWKFTQRSWVGGRLDAELMGRQDLQKYFQGASEIINFTIRRQGNLSKRRGTDLACDLKYLLGSEGGVHEEFTCTREYFTTTLKDALRCELVGGPEPTLRHGNEDVFFYVGNVILIELEFFGLSGDYEDYALSKLGDTYYVMDKRSRSYVREIRPDEDPYYVNCDILPYHIVKIGSARLLPVVYEKDNGNYLLLTHKRAFVVSKNGIRTMSGAYVKSVAEYTYSDYADEVVENDQRPYYVPVPYEDADLDGLDFRQSGDTIFVVHRRYAPARFTFYHQDDSVSYTQLDFTSSRWKRPAISNITAEGFGNQGATKTVYYVCTYVKDGIESLPSPPYAFTYVLPWADSASVKIEFSKGDNELEPDYYNVYKKESVEYGLISTYGIDSLVMAYPTLVGASAIAGVAENYLNHEQSSILTYGTSQASTKLSGWMYNGFHGCNIDEDAWLTTVGGCGGIAFSGGTLNLDFGESSNTVISKIYVGLDSFVGTDKQMIYGYVYWSGDGSFLGTLVNRRMSDERDYYGRRIAGKYKFIGDYYKSGNYFVATLKLRTDTLISGGYTEDGKYYYNITKNITLESRNEYPLGNTHFEIEQVEVVVSEFEDIINSQRTLEIDFTEDIVSAFGAFGGRYTFQVAAISIVSYDAVGGNVVPFYCNNISFSNAYGVGTTVVDDYTTPDLTITPPVVSDHFHSLDEFPSAVGIFKQRLVFANTRTDPFKFWLSSVGDLLDFNTHSSIRESDSISATLDATEMPNINHIVQSRDLMLFTDSGEWQIRPVSGNTLSYKTISSTLQSVIGCSSTVKPIEIGEEVMFVKKTGESMIATRYNWSSDGYDTTDLSVLSQWILRDNPIVQMAYRQNPDSVIECVLKNGDIACLVYMKEHEICAWTRAQLGGGWKARGIATCKSISSGSTEVIALVEKDGAYALWRERDDVPFTTSVNNSDTAICMDAVREVGVGYEPADGEHLVRIGDKYFVGYVFDAEVVTVRPEPHGDETIQFEIKNAKDTEVRILDSGDYSVVPYGVDDSQAQHVVTGGRIGDDGSVVLASKDIKTLLVGKNSGDGRIKIFSSNEFPLNILSISTNYEIQPISGSEG